MRPRAARPQLRIGSRERRRRTVLMTNGERSVDRKDAQLALADTHGLRACPVALVVGLTRELSAANAVSNLTANSTRLMASGFWEYTLSGVFPGDPIRVTVDGPDAAKPGNTLSL
jgi:hypothetical protein